MLRSAATTVPFTIRGAVDADAQAVIWVHRAAVRRTAAAFYTPTIVDAWAAKDNSETLRRTREEIADEAMVVIVAEENAKVVAFGMIVPGDEELRAVYVHPDAGRRGLARQSFNGSRRARLSAARRDFSCIPRLTPRRSTPVRSTPWSTGHDIGCGPVLKWRA